MKMFRWYMPIACVYIAVLLISNITSTKLVELWPLVFDGGTLLFPLAYVFGDVLTEVYGYKASRKIIWMWLVTSVLLAGLVMLVGWLPAAWDWVHQDAYMNILWLTPRIILASSLAYFVGEFSNAYILAKMKIADGWKYFWKRALGSTIVGQWLDTLLFVIIAFAGIFPWSVIWAVVISNYIFKIWVEVVLLPVTTKVTIWLKKEEEVDVYDEKTDFSPLHW